MPNYNFVHRKYVSLCDFLKDVKDIFNLDERNY